MDKLSLRLMFSAAALGAALAHADVAFNNLGAGNSFNELYVWGISGPNSTNGSDNFAFQFTSATSGHISWISLGTCVFTTPGTLNIGIYSDAGNTLGSLIDSASLALTSQSSLLYTLPTATGAALVTGQKYWFALSTPDDAYLGWNINSIGMKSLSAFRFDSPTPYYENNTTMGAFRVETQAVPEPAAFVALGMGSLALLPRRKR
jgi:hypothetical protein